MSIVIANGKCIFLLHIHLSNLFLHSWGSCPPNTVCMRCVIQLNWKTLSLQYSSLSLSVTSLMSSNMISGVYGRSYLFYLKMHANIL